MGREEGFLGEVERLLRAAAESAEQRNDPPLVTLDE
jgi:hypothetical protein